jgi:sporulation protein YlmC with PRC-barrel domain
MNSKGFNALVTVVALALVAGAQTPQGGTDKQGTGTTGQTGGQTGRSGQGQTGTAGTGQTGGMGQTGKAGEMTPGGTATNRGLRLMRAEDVVGMQIQGTTGENLGKVEEIVVHPRGEVAYAVISLDAAAAGGTAKTIAIPWSVLQQPNVAGAVNAGDGRKLMLAVDKTRLASAPAFDKSAKLSDPAWSKDVDTFFAGERRTGGATGRPVEAGARMAGSPVWRASELKGTKVETPTGENLGEIEEVVIDPNGRISYVAIDVGGFLGMGERRVAVPFEALNVAGQGDAQKVTLTTTKDRLKEAPEFRSGKENWAAMSDPIFVGRVYEYYSVRPYWNDGGMGTGRDAGMGTGGSRDATGTTGGTSRDTTGGSRGTGTGTGTDKPKTDKPDKP